MKKLVLFFGLLFFVQLANAGWWVEDWSSGRLRVKGTFYTINASVYFEPLNIGETSPVWWVNAPIGQCRDRNYIEGPNQCISVSNKQAYFHVGQMAGGSAEMLATDPFQFTSIIQSSVTANPYCTSNTTPSSCFLNIGLWDNEFNYRAFGFKGGSSGGYMTIWTPYQELVFNGANGLPSVSLAPGIDHTFTITYVHTNPFIMGPAGYTWNYYIDGLLKYSHTANNTDTFATAGKAYFPSNKTRTVLTYGGFPDNLSSVAGSFKTVGIYTQ